MLKVILPKESGSNFNGVTDDVLRDVCLRIFNSAEFVTEYDDRSSGQYFRVIDTHTQAEHFVLFNNANNSRNTRLIQPFPVGYIDYLESDAADKTIHIYFINPETSDRTQYAKLFYRCFMTMGISMLNFETLGLSGLTPYQGYDDLKSERNANRDRNSHNASTYFDDNDDDITIFGKTDGVNEKETFILALTIARIVAGTKPFFFYPVKSDMSTKYKAVLMAQGIAFRPVIDILPNGKAKPVASVDIEDIRNTTAYHLNLYQKYGDKQCYLCGCDIDHMIIGAHIERVADIKRSVVYEQSEKLERAVDGDNGFWLCANHDKMFEYGVIYFEESTLRVRSFINDQHQKEFIRKSIFEMRNIYFTGNIGTTFNINKEHYNNKMREYLNKHLVRHSIVVI